MNQLLAHFRRLRGRLSLSSDNGSMLIEVMVGAVLVISVSAAVLEGLSGAQDTGQRNRARSVSASIAQQDQERLRGKPVTQLSNYRESRTVTLQNIAYTVESRSDWVRDASGVVSCTNDSTNAQYLKISSSVNSKVNSESPVTQTSLVSPPRGAFSADQGTAAVQVVDRDRKPLAGVRVDLVGPQSFSDVTNELGCVVFGYIQKGAWKANISSLGLVGTDGKSPFVADLDVAGGSTVFKQVLLDQPASITTSFNTLKSGASIPEAMNWPTMSIANSQMPSPGSLAFTPTPVGPKTSITAAKVFPFLDGYGVYAGDCDANNPSRYIPAYFSTSPGTAAFANPAPAGSANVVARLPAINVTVKNSAGTAQSSARVFLKASNPDDLACTTPAWVGGSVPTASPWMQKTGDGVNPVVKPVAKGKLPAPGLPFGRYAVCADNNLSTTSARRTLPTVADIVNTNPAGTAVTSLTYGASLQSPALCAPVSP
jgi:type II secretory pathway pseudopilin PulG